MTNGNGNDIEMKVFKTFTDDHGSYRKTIDRPNGSYVEVIWDAVKREVEVKTISSNAPGDGAALMADVYQLATAENAQRIFTATSRPGFFKKLRGFDYSDEQKRVNAEKYSAEELAAQEENRSDKGGAFVLEMFPPYG